MRGGGGGAGGRERDRVCWAALVQPHTKITVRVQVTIMVQTYPCLRQGPALEGPNSPVFAKRFWKGNK